MLVSQEVAAVRNSEVTVNQRQELYSSDVVEIRAQVSGCYIEVTAIQRPGIAGVHCRLLLKKYVLYFDKHVQSVMNSG